MRIRVHYVSPKGSAEQIAEVCSRVAQCVKEPLLPAYMPENIALMFLGCEGSKVDKVTLEFISSLNADRVKNAALFCCGKGDSAIVEMKSALEKRGINVLPDTLVTPVKGLFGGGPQNGDLEGAKKFAEKCIASIESNS